MEEGINNRWLKAWNLKQILYRMKGNFETDLVDLKKYQTVLRGFCLAVSDISYTLHCLSIKLSKFTSSLYGIGAMKKGASGCPGQNWGKKDQTGA